MSPFGCSPLVIQTFACSNQETASSNGRHRSTFATCLVLVATGQLRDVSAASLAAMTVAGPTSDTLTEGANTACASADGPGSRKLSRPCDSAFIFGLNAKYVSSSVTSALITVASSIVAGCAIPTQTV